MQEVNKIYCGDALGTLSKFPDGAAQMCVTSPPYYGLRQYGVPGQLGLEETPDVYIKKMVEVFREVKRVLRDDGTLWLNLGDSYAGVGNLGDTQGKHGSITRDCQFRCPKVDGLPVKNLIGIPWKVAFALQGDGWILRSDIIWHKPNPMPESVTDRPTKSHEYIFLLSKNLHYYYDNNAVKEPISSVSLERAKYAWNCDRPGAKVGEKGIHTDKMGNRFVNTEGRNMRDVWTIPVHGFNGAHFAIFPEKLIIPCIKAGSKIDDIILDPFMGAGTTALVAKKLDRKYIGIELNPEYVKIAEERINKLNK